MHFYKLLGILLKENHLLHVVYLSRCIPLARDQKGLQRVWCVKVLYNKLKNASPSHTCLRILRDALVLQVLLALPPWAVACYCKRDQG